MMKLGSRLMCVMLAGSVAALSAPAMADGPLRRGSIKDETYQPAPFSWRGFYVGAQVGYSWGDADHSFSNGAPSDNSDPRGFVAGGHAGYNFQSGNVVFGIEADLEGGNLDGSFVNLTGITSQGAVDLNWQGSLRGRVGIASGQALYYLTGGWAFGDFDFGGGPAGGPICCGYSERMNGWTVGGGGEWALGRNMTARIEYRYTDFGSASGGLSPVFPGVTMPVELETHTVRAGLSYKF